MPVTFLCLPLRGALFLPEKEWEAGGTGGGRVRMQMNYQSLETGKNYSDRRWCRKNGTGGQLSLSKHRYAWSGCQNTGLRNDISVAEKESGEERIRELTIENPGKLLDGLRI